VSRQRNEVQTFFTKNRILQMLGQNQIPVGMQCFTGDHNVTKVAGQNWRRVLEAARQRQARPARKGEQT
jgi:hypothetical protein